MSQSADAQDPGDPNISEQPHNTSSTSSGSSTSSNGRCSAPGSSNTTLTSASASKATVTGGTDLDDNRDNLEHRQQQCFGPPHHSGNLGDINRSKSPPSDKSTAARLEKGSAPQSCDTSIGSSKQALSPRASTTQSPCSSATLQKSSSNVAKQDGRTKTQTGAGFTISKTPQHSISARRTLPEQSNTRTNSVGSFSTLINETDSSPSNRRDTTIDQTRLLGPAPSPSPSLSVLDTNNNKSAIFMREDLVNTRKTNCSKSASGARLVSRSRPNVCDCLSQNCKEKEHSTRRQFIEHYYKSRTQLPSTNAMSSINISTPLNRLNECDAITKRLLSSPRRGPSINENSCRRMQAPELDMSRRASLGADTITEHLYLFSSNPFNSVESNNRISMTQQEPTGNPSTKCDPQRTRLTTDDDAKSSKQQQARSLSVCDDEARKPKLQDVRLNHSPNLSRAVSLACDSSGQSRRLQSIIPLFGCEVKTLEQFTKVGLALPPVINSAVDHIVENGINSVGIFRKSGVKSRILTLKQLIETNQEVRFEEINKENEYSIHDIADLVKMWFRELKPTPLMTKDLIRLITDSLNQQSSQSADVQRRNDLSTRAQFSGQRSSQKFQGDNFLMDSKMVCLKARIGAMTTPVQRAIFSRALAFLSIISSQSETNQMTSQNLAICLTPSLCATDADQSSIIAAQKALEFCIDNYHTLF